MQELKRFRFQIFWFKFLFFLQRFFSLYMKMLTNIVSSANVDVLDGISAISASWARQYTHYVCTCTWLHVWNRVRLLLHFNRNKKMPNLLKMLHLSPLWLFSIILKHMIIVHQSVSWQFNELCADTLSNCVGVKGGSEFGLQFCLEVMHLEQIFLSDNIFQTHLRNVRLSCFCWAVSSSDLVIWWI